MRMAGYTKSNISVNTRSIKSKIYMEFPCEWVINVYNIVQGHMTNMAAMSIFGKIFKTKSIESVFGLDLSQIYINRDPGTTVTYFLRGQTTTCQMSVSGLMFLWLS